MATVKINTDKTGKTISYRFRACVGRTKDGKQKWATKTVPPLGLTPKKEMKEMQRQADEWEKSIKAGAIPVQDDTFEDFLDNTFWPLHVQNGEHKPSTVTFYTNMRTRCIEYFGGKKMTAIRKVDVEKFVLWLREQKTKNGQPLSAGTLKHYYNFLRITFLFAVDHDIIPKNPMRGIAAPKQPHRDVVYLHPEQARQFLQALADAPLRWQAIMQLLIYLGLRRGEVCGLQWQDIDYEHSTVNIRRNVVYTPAMGIQVGEPKTKNSIRTLPVPASVLAILRKWQSEQANTYAPAQVLPTAYVFSADADPYTPQFPTHITKKVKAFMREHDLPDMSPHDLRHTCGSLMLENGANLKAVQQFLGHEDVETTLKFYAGVNQDSLKKASDALSMALGG